MSAVIIGMIFGALTAVGLAIAFPPDDVMRGVLCGAFYTMVGGLAGIRAAAALAGDTGEGAAK